VGAEHLQPGEEASLEFFACPRCRGALEATADGARCSACEAAYPVVGGLPCLVEDPPLWRALWHGRLEDYLATSASQLGVMADQASDPSLLERTRQRIRHVHDAVASDRRTLVDLFADFEAGSGPGIPSLSPGAGSRTSGTPLLALSEQLFRDFVWGRREAEQALELVKRLAPGPLGTTAVFGVGTGRLALDLKRELDAGQVLGFDINPLPLLVTSRLLRGEELDFHEYPLAPHSSEATAVRQRLRAPFAKPSGVVLAFADALRPPLPPGSLDTVITPWFIDFVSADVRTTAAAVNHALRPGGSWLSFGPLRFEGSLSRLYSIDEVHEIVAASSFELGARFSEDLPYMHSPHSGCLRTDRVFAFSARKTGEAAALPAPSLFPPWLANPSLPVPVNPEFARIQKTSVLTVGILSMIDGERSVAAIAGTLAQQWGLPPSTVLTQLRSFLARLLSEG
jgi:uncharacterized protein YbaR (Trm112 family)